MALIGSRSEKYHILVLSIELSGSVDQVLLGYSLDNLKHFWEMLYPLKHCEYLHKDSSKQFLQFVFSF